MNERLIDYYLSEQGYEPDEIEEYKMNMAEDAYNNRVDDDLIDRATGDRK